MDDGAPLGLGWRLTGASGTRESSCLSQRRPMLNLFAFCGMVAGVGIANVQCSHARYHSGRRGVRSQRVREAVGILAGGRHIVIGVIMLLLARMVAARVGAGRERPVGVADGGMSACVTQLWVFGARLEVRTQQMLQGRRCVAGFVVGVARTALRGVVALTGHHGIGSRDRPRKLGAFVVFALPVLAVIEIPSRLPGDTPSKRQVMLRFQRWVRSNRQRISPS